jgi:MSHA pilin protein MshD
MCRNSLSTKGFTLIEIIVALVALAISMTVILSLIVPAEKQSADQLHQIKAAELGQSFLDEILGRAFDENSDMAGSHWRCDETGYAACTATINFGTDSGESNRELFDDVDDYNGFNLLVNSTNNNLNAGYNSFKVDVAVSYQGSELGLADNRLAKRVIITITTPLNSKVRFTGYKSNF